LSYYYHQCVSFVWRRGYGTGDADANFHAGCKPNTCADANRDTFTYAETQTDGASDAACGGGSGACS
jgi:hypothetical protein